MLSLTKLLTFFIVLALLGTVLLAVRWYQDKRYVPAVGIVAAFVASTTAIYAATMNMM